MTTLTPSALGNLLVQKFAQGFSYEEFRTLSERLTADGKTTGVLQDKELIHYTALNDARMRRWDKKITIPESVKNTFNQNKTVAHWLVLTESWCGDAAHNIPVLQKIAEELPGVTLKVILRDENETLMNQFLTNGGKAIPKLIAFDPNSKVVLYTWGPRPKKAIAVVEALRDDQGTLDPSYKEALQKFYNKNKGMDIIKEFTQLV